MTDWTLRTSAADNSWTSVAYGFVSGTPTFVAVANSGTNNRVMTSSDGTIWASPPLTNANRNNNWTSVTYGNGLFVAVANSGSTLRSDRVMTSTDGTSWAEKTSAANNSWTSVTYGFVSGTPTFVAVANTGTDNRVMTSSNGTSWTLRTLTNANRNNNWTSVTYGNGLFVAVASSGSTTVSDRVMTSSNGTSWTLQTSAANNSWTSVTYGFVSGTPTFVAVANTGTNNRVMTSSNGITWTLRTSAADYNWTSVAYGNGLFVAVASSGSSLVSDRVMTSPNGINWTLRNSAANNFWLSITYGNGLFVAVSNSGTNNRVMTGVDNSCFLKGSLILTSTGEYIPIENLTSGMLIKTYKHDDKKIYRVGKKYFSNSSQNKLCCIYTDEINNLSVSGGHSILVDSLTQEQQQKQNEIGFNSKIEDKFLLLVCNSEQFKKIEPDNKLYVIYHLCLENDDLDGHYGIWANNVLTETCSINHFKNVNFEE